MPELFTVEVSSESGDSTIAVVRGTGLITNISTPAGESSAVNISVKDEEGTIYHGWALADSEVYEVAKAAQEDEVSVDYRIEMSPKNASHNVLELLAKNNLQGINNFFSMIDDVTFEKALSDPDNDFDNIENNSFNNEDLQEIVRLSKPAVAKGKLYDLYNSEGGPSYESAAIIAAVSMETFSRDRLIAEGLIMNNQMFTSEHDAESLILEHTKELLQLANRVQARLYERRPGFTVDMTANSHTRIRGIIFDTLSRGVDTGNSELSYSLYSKESREIVREVVKLVEDIVYSRMKRLGRLVIDPDLNDLDNLFS